MILEEWEIELIDSWLKGEKNTIEAYLQHDYRTNKEIQFLSLVKRLEKYNLILSVSTRIPLHPNNISVAYDYYNVKQLHPKFVSMERIIPLPELHQFKENGYKTKQELRYDKEERDRKNAQKLTLVVALASIGVSALFSLFSFLFPWPPALFKSDAPQEVIVVNQTGNEELMKFIESKDFSPEIIIQYPAPAGETE